jgi:L-histidine N-alpha-methyltransferase
MKSSLKHRVSRIEVRNHLEDTFYDDIRRDIFQGLTAPKKFIPSKYFYDAEGSRLFEEICSVPEYYPTRTEMSILKDASSSIMQNFPEGDIVEFGSGANHKIRMLLDAADDPSMSAYRYVPVDVSEAALTEASEELIKIYPQLGVLGIITDFTKHVELIPNERPRLFLLLGSTIGNFHEEKCISFLHSLSHSMKPEDRFLVGIDMLKPKGTIEAAYNDSAGITSKFNKNVLSVLNRELNACFNETHFDHLAFFNHQMKRVEMHLKANRDVSVFIGELGLTIELEVGETIHTEICRKFSREYVEQIALDSGFLISQWYSDPREWFSLVEMRVK